MKRAFNIGFISIVYLLVSGNGLADDKYSISGEVSFTGEETITSLSTQMKHLEIIKNVTFKTIPPNYKTHCRTS